MRDSNYDDLTCSGPGSAHAPLPGGEGDTSAAVGASEARGATGRNQRWAHTASDFVPVDHVVEPQFHGPWITGED
jgi:hypothetical protein